MADSVHFGSTPASVPPHALLIPAPVHGHITPMMHLAHRLAPMGVRVTLLTLDHFVARMADHYASGNPRVVGIPDVLSPHFEKDSSLGLSVTLTMESNLEAALQKALHTLTCKEGVPPVTCIVGDFFLRLTRSLAHKNGLPEFVFYPLGVSTFASCSDLGHALLHMQSDEEGDAVVPANDFVERVGDGGSSELQFDVPFELPFDKSGLQRYIMELMKTRFGQLREAAGVIVNSMEDLEAGICSAAVQSARLIGPLVSPSLLGVPPQPSESLTIEERECIQWLDMQPPSSVLYIAFGSMVKYSLAQLHELALGLAASQQRFLWALRKDLVFNINPKHTVLDALPYGFLEETMHRAKIIHWAPQVHVLSHASVGGFFQHCGWNSTLEGVVSGVPILAWPWLMDQFAHCSLVCDKWKVGIELERDEENRATKEDVERGVRKLMEGCHSRELRERTSSFKTEIIKALHSSDGAYQNNLKALVNDMRHSHLNRNLRSLL